MGKSNLDDLSRILDEEIYSFRQLLKYEKLKNTVIIKQEADKLKQLSQDEEEILNKVAELEEEREDIVNHLFEKYNLTTDKALSALIEKLSKNDHKERISEKRIELIRNIKDLKNVNEVNNKLLTDSIQFFNYAVNSIQDIDSVVYNKNGSMPKEYDNSWVINKKA